MRREQVLVTGVARLRFGLDGLNSGESSDSKTQSGCAARQHLESMFR